MATRLYTEPTVPEWKGLPFFSIIALTIISIILSIYFLRNDVLYIFQNIYYFPIILSCAFYPKKGLYFSIFISFMYFALVYYFNNQSYILFEALIRSAIFIIIAGVVAYLSHIRVQTLKELKQSQLKYESLLSNVSGLIYRYNYNKRILFISEKASQLTGYSPSDFLSRDCFLFDDLIHPDDIRSYHDAVSEAVATEGQWEIEYRIITKDGQLKWVLDKGQQIIPKQGIEKFFDGVMLDITQQKKTSEDKRIEALDATIEAIGLINTKGEYVYMNTAHVLLFGYQSSEELLGKNWTTLFSAEEGAHLKNILIPCLQKVKHWRGETTGKKKDHALFPMELSLTLLNDGSMIGVVRDITSELEAQQREKDILVERNTLVFKQNFLANMSHEMRTPLTGIMGMAEIFNHWDLNAEQKEYVNVLNESTENLKNIIDQVLDITSIERGEFVLNTVEISFHDLIQNLGIIFQSQCRTKSLSFKLVFDPNVPDIIIADKARIVRVIQILVSNAIKFTASGEVKISVKSMHLASNELHHLIYIEVEDTGIGIPEDEHPYLFQPLKKLHQTDTRGYDGSGLGLIIAKQIVGLHGGEIGFSSEKNKGSVFWFTFETQG